MSGNNEEAIAKENQRLFDAVSERLSTIQIALSLNSVKGPVSEYAASAEVEFTNDVENICQLIDKSSIPSILGSKLKIRLMLEPGFIKIRNKRKAERDAFIIRLKTLMAEGDDKKSSNKETMDELIETAVKMGFKKVSNSIAPSFLFSQKANVIAKGNPLAEMMTQLGQFCRVSHEHSWWGQSFELFMYPACGDALRTYPGYDGKPLTNIAQGIIAIYAKSDSKIRFRLLEFFRGLAKYLKRRSLGGIPAFSPAENGAFFNEDLIQDGISAMRRDWNDNVNSLSGSLPESAKTGIREEVQDAQIVANKFVTVFRKSKKAEIKYWMISTGPKREFIIASPDSTAMAYWRSEEATAFEGFLKKKVLLKDAFAFPTMETYYKNNNFVGTWDEPEKKKKKDKKKEMKKKKSSTDSSEAKSKKKDDDDSSEEEEDSDEEVEEEENVNNNNSKKGKEAELSTRTPEEELEAKKKILLDLLEEERKNGSKTLKIGDKTFDITSKSLRRKVKNFIEDMEQ